MLDLDRPSQIGVRGSRTRYLIPGRDGMGAGLGQRILPPPSPPPPPSPSPPKGGQKYDFIKTRSIL